MSGLCSLKKHLELHVYSRCPDKAGAVCMSARQKYAQSLQVSLPDPAVYLSSPEVRVFRTN